MLRIPPVSLALLNGLTPRFTAGFTPFVCLLVLPVKQNRFKVDAPQLLESAPDKEDLWTIHM